MKYRIGEDLSVLQYFMQTLIFLWIATNVCYLYTQGQSYEDVRCKCVCPNPSVVNGTQSNRKLYIGNVPPNKW